MAKASKGPTGFNLKRTFKVVAAAGITRGFAAIKGTNEDEADIAGAAAAGLGIMEETTLLNGYGAVVTHGECIAIAGGAVVQGDWVKTDASGKLVASAGEDTANMGRAMSGAAADGDEFVLFVNPVKKRS
jgi:hypothetical protein